MLPDGTKHRMLDIRFTDLRGRAHHYSHVMSPDRLKRDGLISISSASVDGWRLASESDMLLHYEAAAIRPDPQRKDASFVYADVQEVAGQEVAGRRPYNRDPRHIARKALEWCQDSIGELSFGPELEFYVFDSVKFKSSVTTSFTVLANGDSAEGLEVNDPAHSNGFRATQPMFHLQLPPQDRFVGLRDSMSEQLIAAGVEVLHHHHESGPGQNEITLGRGNLLAAADSLQTAKHVIRMTADAVGKAVTFMPKPVGFCPGSGLHLNLSLWSNGVNLFAGDACAGVSEAGLHAVGGILRHIRAIAAFSNASTNSYLRLWHIFNEPLNAFYSVCNRLAPIRIPHAPEPEKARLELRFPDSGGNVYLTFAAIAMAAADGLRNRIDPGPIGEAPPPAPDWMTGGARLAHTLREATEALERDHAFLLQGEVFDKDVIAAYAKLKYREARSVEHIPSPSEFEWYYSL